MSLSTGLDVSSGPLVWATTSLALLSAAVYISRNRSRKQAESSVPPAEANANEASNGAANVVEPPETKTFDPFAPIEDDTRLSPNEVLVTKILVHPIKSCRGMSVEEWRYTPAGLEDDRKWCIIDARTNSIITAREISKMVLITPRLEYDAASPHKGLLHVSVPRGEEDLVHFSVPIDPNPDILLQWPMIEECIMFGTYKIDAYVCGALAPGGPTPSQILSEYLERDVHLVMKGPARRACDPTMEFPDLQASTQFQDGYPLLDASEESLWAVENAVRRAASRGPTGGDKIAGIDRGKWHDGELEIERFRPNIVVEGAGKPFSEDSWQRIVISPRSEAGISASMIITLVSKCARCLLPNVDPQTGIRDPAVPYKVLMKFRTGIDPANMNKPCFGCNGVVEGHGTVRVGDSVTVIA